MKLINVYVFNVDLITDSSNNYFKIRNAHPSKLDYTITFLTYHN